MPAGVRVVQKLSTNLEIFLHIAVFFLSPCPLLPSRPFPSSSSLRRSFPAALPAPRAVPPRRTLSAPLHPSLYSLAFLPVMTSRSDWYPHPVRRADPSWTSAGPCAARNPSLLTFQRGPITARPELAGFEAREPCHDRKKMHL